MRVFSRTAFNCRWESWNNCFPLFSRLTVDSATFDGQPSFLGGSDLTSAEHKNLNAYTSPQRSTCRHLLVVNTVSVCVCGCRCAFGGWGEVMEMQGIIKLSHVQFVRPGWSRVPASLMCYCNNIYLGSHSEPTRLYWQFATSYPHGNKNKSYI